MRLIGENSEQLGIVSLFEALRMARERNVDLVEVAPPFDVGTITSFNGASILFEILCLLAEAWQKRTGA